MPGSKEGSAETIGIIDQLISIGTVRRCLSSESQMAEREEGFEFHMGFLKLESLSRILDLQRIISESLPSREIFILHDEEYFRRIFSLRRSVIGIICEGELIGYSFILIPGLRDDGLCENLGIDLDLPVDELLKVAHLQGLAVHPAYRGNGLQRMMAAAHLKMIAEMGYVHACSTVSPNLNFAHVGNNKPF
jgi:ribosomal protein S18 acetylase RimI-like enzyme